jgi:cysteine desulfurase
VSARVYLDWNATAPLRPEARDAMLAAMEVVGNPSSVHAEGRAARAIVERARTQVAALVGCAVERIVFTSGATEANNMGLSAVDAGGFLTVACSDAEHPSILEHAEKRCRRHALPITAQGRIDRATFEYAGDFDRALGDWLGWSVLGVSLANSETGVVEDVSDLFRRAWALRVRGHCDVTQSVGRVEIAVTSPGAISMALSSHKLGGPAGVGAFVESGESGPEDKFAPKRLFGGGQEGGWRAGTENVIGIAGFGAAAEAAQRDLDSGVWDRVATLRDQLEARIADSENQVIIVGRESPRLPNTSCIAVPGWRGETQVMQLDLAGVAVSAGSACSSGKVRESRVLRAMGFDDITARSAIRVSLGPTTTEAAIDRFCEIWTGLYRKRRAKAA